jgi:hypothetical protein
MLGCEDKTRPSTSPYCLRTPHVSWFVESWTTKVTPGYLEWRHMFRFGHYQPTLP